MTKNNYCNQCGIPHQPGQCGRTKPKHRGRFNWRKHSAHKGNLRTYWQDSQRTTERHRADG